MKTIMILSLFLTIQQLTYAKSIVSILDSQTSIPIAVADLEKCTKSQKIALKPSGWPDGKRFDYYCHLENDQLFFRLELNGKIVGSFYTKKSNEIMLTYPDAKIDITLKLQHLED